jgi:hypothetical protein
MIIKTHCTPDQLPCTLRTAHCKPFVFGGGWGVFLFVAFLRVSQVPSPLSESGPWDGKRKNLDLNKPAIATTQGTETSLGVPHLLA